MKSNYLLLLIIIISCKSDDCEPTIDNSNVYPKLVEADFIAFANFGIQGTNCDPLLVVSVDSFKTEEKFYIMDSMPINMVVSPDIAYKGIVKIENRFGACINPISEGNQNETYQYANLLYWELIR